MELWKDIIDFENYEVSSFGNVRNKKTELLLKPNIHRQGYHMFKPSKNNIRFTFLAHRLVACAFIENPNNYPQVDHIDRNKSNNNIENLRWVTPEQNLWNRDYKHISIRQSGSFMVDYSISKGIRNQTIFKTEQEAIDYLTELKIKYPRII
jgi:hypothetical protein